MPGFDELKREGVGTCFGFVGKLVKSPAKGQVVSDSNLRWNSKSKYPKNIKLSYMEAATRLPTRCPRKDTELNILEKSLI
jgi:hypothetical protein